MAALVEKSPAVALDEPGESVGQSAQDDKHKPAMESSSTTNGAIPTWNGATDARVDPLSTTNGAAPTSSEKTHQVASTQSGPMQIPFASPLASATPPPLATLTPDQEQKYETLLSTVRSWDTVPATSARDAPLEPMTDDERMWLTRECLLRYLRAVKWNEAEAPKRLLGTLTWRREYGIKGHTADYISPENELGKQVVLGFDNACRPCLYLRPSQQNTERTPRQVQHLVFMLERLIDIMVPGQETLCLLVDFKNSSGGSGGPSVSQGRQVLSILQTHYPERLGRALVINVPWAVWGFFKLITPFIDPLTREKLKFNEDLRLHVPPAQLWSTMGGDVDFSYDHSIYWPALNRLASEQREALRERWIHGGKQVGESEVYLKGGIDNSSVQVGQQSGVAQVDP